MEQIVLDACKLFGVDSSAVVESTIRITEVDVSFVVNLGVRGSPKLRFHRTDASQLKYDQSQSAFPMVATVANAEASATIVPQPQPATASGSVTINVGFAKTQEMTPQKRAWQDRRKAAKEG